MKPGQSFAHYSVAAKIGGGYTHMAEAFMDLIRTGKRDSEVMPLAESLTIMETMDTLRGQWDLKYPME